MREAAAAEGRVLVTDGGAGKPLAPRYGPLAAPLLTMMAWRTSWRSNLVTWLYNTCAVRRAKGFILY